MEHLHPSILFFVSILNLSWCQRANKLISNDWFQIGTMVEAKSEVFWGLNQSCCHHMHSPGNSGMWAGWCLNTSQYMQHSDSQSHSQSEPGIPVTFTAPVWLRIQIYFLQCSMWHKSGWHIFWRPLSNFSTSENPHYKFSKKCINFVSNASTVQDDLF